MPVKTKKNKTRLSKTMNGKGSSKAALADFVEFVSMKFDLVDKQHTGFIASGQLRELLEHLGAAPQPLDQIRSIALLLDPDYSDRIKKTDFLRFWITREMAPKRAQGLTPGSSAQASVDPGSNSLHSSKSTPATASPTSGVAAHLAEAARARKEAQENARLLANRVAMLREEKMRTIKCIADANKQAQKITEWKRQQEQRRLQRRQQGKERERASRAAAKEFAERKRLNMERKAKKSEEIYRQKMAIATAVRREKKMAQKHKKRMDKQYKDRARQTHHGVQQLHQNLKQRKAEMAEKRIEEAQRAYTSKIKQEEKIRKQNEKSISVLEEEEAGLIQELQNAQLMQEDALSGLQYLLSTRVVGNE